MLLAATLWNWAIAVALELATIIEGFGFLVLYWCCFLCFSPQLEHFEGSTLVRFQYCKTDYSFCIGTLHHNKTLLLLLLFRSIRSLMFLRLTTNKISNAVKLDKNWIINFALEPFTIIMRFGLFIIFFSVIPIYKSILRLTISKFSML